MPRPSEAIHATEDDDLTEESFRAIVSSNQRGGRWAPADSIDVRAICGEVILDFTHADLPPSGIVEIWALSIGGEVKIIVPADAEIELDGTPILGSIEHERHKKKTREWIRELVTGEEDEDLASQPIHAEPPLFRVDGRAILGTIKVVSR